MTAFCFSLKQITHTYLLICIFVRNWTCYKLSSRFSNNALLPRRADVISGFSFMGNCVCSFTGCCGESSQKMCLPTERDWKLIHDFDFTGRKLLGAGDSMRKSLFRNSACSLGG